MSELAYNINGEAFEVPANATGWRVRKMRPKGSPEVVYAREGQPLLLPIDADMEALRAEVDTSGRYRLDLVDQNNKAIATAPSGYLQVNLDTSPVSESSAGSHSVALLPPSDNIAIEALRTQAMIAQSVVERFPQMMEAAATLLRAADGAGLPARPGMALGNDEDDDEEDNEGEDNEPRRKSGGIDIVALLTPILPLVVNGLVSGKMKLPDLAALLDWRKAKPRKAANDGATIATTTEAPGSAAASSTAIPTLNMAQARRFVEIQQALTPDEAEFARKAASNLTPTEIAAWLKELSDVSLEQAVQKIRDHIARSNAQAGGAA